jgi:hypothetical protein
MFEQVGLLERENIYSFVSVKHVSKQGSVRVGFRGGGVDPFSIYVRSKGVRFRPESTL